MPVIHKFLHKCNNDDHKEVTDSRPIKQVEMTFFCELWDRRKQETTGEQWTEDEIQNYTQILGVGECTNNRRKG